MRFPLLTALIAIFILIQAGAAQSDPAGKPPLPTARSKAECLAIGGRWGWNGMPRGPEPSDSEGFCILATQDGGKPCSSSRQCQGMCEATSDSAATRQGECTSTNFTGGCHSWVEDGVPAPVLCAD